MTSAENLARYRKQVDRLCRKEVPAVTPRVLTGIEKHALEETAEISELEQMWRQS